MPKPQQCETCHARPTNTGRRAYPNQGPPADFLAGEDYPGSGHYLGKDCQSCHQTPVEGANGFNFTHSQPAADFCLPCHFNGGSNEHNNENNVNLTAYGNCFTCHKAFDAQNGRNFD